MITVRYMGPYSPQLFESLFIANDYADFEEVAIATGESKAVAAARAISHLQGKGFGPIMDQIIEFVEREAPRNSHFVEGDLFCSVYCILGVSAER
jgi:hypothetical protein